MLFRSPTIERKHVVQALQLGASGMLLKDTSAQLMFASIRCVMEGHCWIGRERLTGMTETVARPAPATQTLSRLTPRELEIVDAVRRGDTNKTIARDLSIAENAVKHHLTAIFSKVGVVTRLQLAVVAMNQNLDRGAAVDAAEMAEAV